MVLGAGEIKKKIELGEIEIVPFKEAHLNPNSYDLTLGDKLLILSGSVIDIKQPPIYEGISIGEEGIVIEPNKVYLAATLEYTKTLTCVPIIFGKSSLSRLGLCIHSTGGFGDIGFKGNWTLTLTSTVPIRIYKGMKICQIAYFDINKGGEEKLYSSEKYQDSKGINASKFYKEFEK